MTLPPPAGPKLFEPDDPGIVASPPPSGQERPGARGTAAAPGGDRMRPPARRTYWPGWGSLLAAALVGLAMLAAAAWLESFVVALLARDDIVGWLAMGLLGLAALAMLVLVGRELAGFYRLARIGRLRREADRALDTKDRALEVATVHRVRHLIAANQQRQWDVGRFREEERHMREPGELMRLADRVLLAGADKEARRIVFESARRVATVTALIPFGALVVLFVLHENVRMIRRVAATYGARPGLVGGMGLLWRTLAYLAATGLVAFGDDFLGQVFGQDLLRRLSRRLGEGAFNAALTARLGSAAVALCRPLPFLDAPPVRARDVVAELFKGLLDREPRQKP